MTDKELMQQALEGWDDRAGFPKLVKAMDAIRERLARQELCRTDGRCQYAIDHGAEGLGHCPPGKCCMPSQEPDCYGYASRLATHLWEKHYKDAAPQWKPFDDLLGVLTQIDNMTSGLARMEHPEIEYKERILRLEGALKKALAQPEQQQDSTCNNTLRAEGKGYPRTCRKCGKGPCIADRVQPAQEPVALETVYETIVYWDEGGGKRSRRELARRIVALYTAAHGVEGNT
jgi:hypothetical protein